MRQDAVRVAYFEPVVPPLLDPSSSNPSRKARSKSALAAGDNRATGYANSNSHVASIRIVQVGCRPSISSASSAIATA